MSNIPHPDDLQNGVEIEKVFEHLPMHLNLGNDHRHPETMIGRANAFRSLEDGSTTIVIDLEGEASEKLGDLTEVFKLYAIGFAGMAHRRGPNDSDSSRRY